MADSLFTRRNFFKRKDRTHLPRGNGAANALATEYASGAVQLLTRSRSLNNAFKQM